MLYEDPRGKKQPVYETVQEDVSMLLLGTFACLFETVLSLHLANPDINR